MPDLSYLPQIALSGIGVGCIYGLIGIGFCVIYNASGIVNFAQGAFVMLGGMLTYMRVHSDRACRCIVAAALAIVVVAALGVVIERLVVRPLWNRKATMFVMILATLAVQIVIERLTLIVAGDQPKTLPPFTDLPPMRIGGIAISYQFLWIVALSLLLIVLLDLLLPAHARPARRCAPARSTARPPHCRASRSSRMLALSFALQRGARRDRRRADHADPVHRVQCRRAVRHLAASSRPSSAASAVRSAPSSAASCWASRRRSRSSRSAPG